MHSVVDADSFLSLARSLAGIRVATLTGRGVNARNKGRIGNAIERALGLSPSSAPGPDVPSADGLEGGIEVKTLPVKDGRVLESTWVCAASPGSVQEETWPVSQVRQKLMRVLFVPVEGGAVPVGQRRVGTAFLWVPDRDEEAVLRRDWEDLADLVAHGLGFAVRASRGCALQLRPKAANAGVRRVGTTVGGEDYALAPQGFYLRRSFTQRVLDDRFPPSGPAVPQHGGSAKARSRVIIGGQGSWSR